MHSKSFTLIEILVVIVVIGILSAFILVGMSSISESANIAKGKSFIDSIDNNLLLERLSYWKFDESSGITMYDSWGTNNGTLSGSPSPEINNLECISNNCLSFNGSTSYISISSTTMNLSTGTTIIFWARRNELSTPGTGIEDDILGNGTSGYNFLAFRQSDNELQLETTTNGDVSISSGLIKDTNWHYYVITILNLNPSWYQDGLLISSGDLVNNNLTINQISRPYYFDGLIDEVRIYTAALPTSQIEQNYFLGLNKLFKNRGIAENEYIERIVELKTNLTQS
ncbi:MAG: hypothetical protein MCSN_3500 [Candidatus Microsyncoccus archaeolyticus]|jgi:prepilin-type N-terminal cleavage/methylation domain-containing protein|nr:MAG: hypothetical protein MCSN_3500 [Candidatus Parcubacteria bacterium]